MDEKDRVGDKKKQFDPQKKPLAFHYTGCLIRILIYNGVCIILQSPYSCVVVHPQQNPLKKTNMFGVPFFFFHGSYQTGGEFGSQAVMGKAVQEIQLESQSWYAKAAAVVEERLNRNKRDVGGKLEKRCLFRVPYGSK